MSQDYSELIGGSALLRRAPGLRHERICSRLHDAIRAGVGNLASAHLLPPRTQVVLAPGTTLCPDLALVAVPTGRIWLAAEIISSEDHKPDTVFKKQVYEDCRLPRLWMIDPRYDNVEIYHASVYGLALKEILALRDTLTEKLLPEFEISLADLFEHRPA